MEKEIGSETEMEEGTGGRRKGGTERRKEMREKVAALGNGTGSERVSSHSLVIYSTSQSSHKIHYRSRDNHSAPPLSAGLNPKACLVIKGT